jgi:hypothetical protein
MLERPRRNRIAKIGAVFIIASMVLFSLSVYLVTSNTSLANNVTIAPGSSYTLSDGYVSAGDDIDYTVSTNLASFNITTYLFVSSGNSFGNGSATQKSSLTGVVVSPSSGNVSLVIKNTGSQSINVDASVGKIVYTTLLTVVTGLVLLPSGIVLVGLYYYSRHVEKRKERRLREY